MFIKNPSFSVLAVLSTQISDAKGNQDYVQEMVDDGRIVVFEDDATLIRYMNDEWGTDFKDDIYNAVTDSYMDSTYLNAEDVVHEFVSYYEKCSVTKVDGHPILIKS